MWLFRLMFCGLSFWLAPKPLCLFGSQHEVLFGKSQTEGSHPSPTMKMRLAWPMVLVHASLLKRL